MEKYADPLPDEEDEPYFEEVKACSYFENYGFCLEFDACQDCNPALNPHSDEEEAKTAPATTTAFSTASVPFKPAAKKTEALSAESQSFKPAAKAHQEAANDPFMDENLGTYVEAQKDCKCCWGYVNNCTGEACNFLGICFCVSTMIHND